MKDKENQEYERVLRELRLVRQQQRKRLYEQAKRANKQTSSTPMAEGPDLKSAQCQFESDLEDPR